MRWVQRQFFVVMRKNDGVKNESNSLYISTSYYDRINFDTYPWWTSISVRILMLHICMYLYTVGVMCARIYVCACICVRCARTSAEWNKKEPSDVAPGKNYNRNRCAPTKLLCPLSYAYVRARMQEHVAWSGYVYIVWFAIWMKRENREKLTSIALSPALCV